ncbi:MAG: very short patch repair endonuclease [Helicobacteraceae bacterium]|jgi:DNA mismatch endonuclease (patch repair protein)|nr:very short patch repair endonuclease [Helicobacteraceae bacterium]
MSDVFDKRLRSFVMRQVKSAKNRSTELKLIEFFKANKIIGWRRSFKLFGKPDFAFPKIKLAVFVDGCFWHGHNCRNVTPKDNAEYWNAKRARNIKRDRLVTEFLQKKGWRVLRIWECELNRKNIASLDPLSFAK